MQIKSYKKEFDYSYTLGVFPTIELLESRGKNVQKVFLSSKGEKNTGVHKIMDICDKNGIEYEINDKLINRLSKKGNVYAAGVFQKYEDRLKDGNHLVLVNPGDMGNLGTIIRTAMGYNISNIAIISPGVDKFDPRVARGSMGAIFRANIEYFESFDEYMGRFPNNSRYAFMLRAEEYLDEIEGVKSPYSLIFGNESSGLDEDYFSENSKGIKIRQSEKVDSFNLAISIGIALFKFSSMTGL